MSRKRIGGYIFVDYVGDHLPLHVHIFKDHRFIGRWDIENQEPMKGDNFEIGRDLRAALNRGGYLLEEGDDND